MSKRHRLDVDEDSCDNSANNKGIIKTVFSTVKRLIPWLHGTEDSISHHEASAPPRSKRPRLESSPIPGHHPAPSNEDDDEPSVISPQTPPPNNYGHAGTVLDSPSSFLFHKQNNIDPPKPPSSSQHLPINGDDHSENSDGSASTSGCSSFVSSSHPQIPGTDDTLQRIQKDLDTSKTYPFHHHQTKVDASVSTESSLTSATFADLTESLRRRPLWSERRPSLDRKPQPVAPSSTRPAFNAALLGPAHLPAKSPVPHSSKPHNSSKFSSPFYDGSTSFGGSSACRRPKKSFSETPYVRPVHVQVNPLQSDNADFLSSTAKKILQSIESTGPPITDSSISFVETALPPFSIDTSKYKRNLPSKSVNKHAVSPPPVASNLLPSKTKTTFTLEPLVPKKLPPSDVPSIKTTTNNVTTSSRIENNESETSVKSNQNEEIASNFRPLSSGAGGKMKTKVCPSQRASSKLNNEIVEEVKLPNVSLPISSLPTFSFDKISPASKKKKEGKSQEPHENQPSPTFNGKMITSTPISTLNKVTSEDKPTSSGPSFTFSSPIPLSTAASSSSSPSSKLPNFHFSQPFVVSPSASKKTTNGESTKQKSNDPSFKTFAAQKPNEENSKEKSTAPSFKPFSFGSQFAPQPGSWECTSCLVRNKREDSACVACSEPKPGAVSSDNKKEESKKNLSMTCSKCHSAPPLFGSDQCDNCQKSTKPQNAVGFGDKFKPPAGSWTCDTCFVQNSSMAVKCVACETRKPGTFENKNTVSTSSSFKFGIPNDTSQPKVTFGTPSSGFTFGTKVSSAETLKEGQTFKFGIPVSSKESTQSPKETLSFKAEDEKEKPFPFGQSTPIKVDANAPSKIFANNPSSKDIVISSSESGKDKPFCFEKSIPKAADVCVPTNSKSNSKETNSVLNDKPSTSMSQTFPLKSNVSAQSTFIKESIDKKDNSNSQIGQAINNKAARDCPTKETLVSQDKESSSNLKESSTIFGAEPAKENNKIIFGSDKEASKKNNSLTTTSFGKDDSKIPATPFTFGTSTPKHTELVKDSSSSTSLFDSSAPKDSLSQNLQSQPFKLGSVATRAQDKNFNLDPSGKKDESQNETNVIKGSSNPPFKFGTLQTSESEFSKNPVLGQPVNPSSKFGAEISKESVFLKTPNNQPFNFKSATTKDSPSSSQTLFKFGLDSSNQNEVAKEPSNQQFQFGSNVSKVTSSNVFTFGAADSAKEADTTNTQSSKEIKFKFGSGSTLKENQPFKFGTEPTAKETQTLKFGTEPKAKETQPLKFGIEPPAKETQPLKFGTEPTAKEPHSFKFEASPFKPLEKPTGITPAFPSENVGFKGSNAFVFGGKDPSTTSAPSFGLAPVAENKSLFAFGSPSTTTSSSSASMFRFGESNTSTVAQGGGFGASQMQVPSFGDPAPPQQQTFFKFGSGEQVTQQQLQSSTPFKFGAPSAGSSEATRPFVFGAAPQQPPSSGGFNFSPFAGSNLSPAVNFGSMVSPSPAQVPSFGQPMSAVDSQSLPPAVPQSFNFIPQGASTPAAPFQFSASGASPGVATTTRRIKKAARKMHRGT